MVGRDRTTLARAEAELGLESLQRNPANNRRVGYSLAQVQAFRTHFGTLAVAERSGEAPIDDCLPELQRRRGQVDHLCEFCALPGVERLSGVGGGHR